MCVYIYRERDMCVYIYRYIDRYREIYTHVREIQAFQCWPARLPVPSGFLRDLVTSLQEFLFFSTAAYAPK